VKSCERREAAEAGGGGNPRRDPSEKQEPHTVMWGKIDRKMDR